MSQATTVKAMAQPHAGALAELRVQDIASTPPGPGQLAIRVHSAAINPADLKVARGDFIGRVLHARVTPLVVGYDFSGVVEQRGDGVTDIGIGDAVFGFLPYARSNRHGTFAEQVVADRATVARKPDAVSHETAAAAATPGLTAIQGLRDHGRLEAGQRVLVIGASGGVGTVAVGVAKRLGAHVTGYCSAHGIGLVRELGADAVIDRGETELRALGERFDVVLDTAAAYSYASCSRLLTKRGAYVTTLPSASLIAGNMLALFSARRCRVILVKPVAADLELLASWMADGLTIPIDGRYPVRDLARAFERLTRGAMRGRIAVDVKGGFEAGA